MIKFLKRFSSSRQRRESAPQLNAAQRQALVFPGVPPAGLPYATYERMLADAMVQTAITLKKLGVLAPSYKVEPANSSREANLHARFVETTFERMKGSPLTILGQAMDAFAKGWSIQELIWTERDGAIYLEQAKAKDPANFGLHVDEFGNIEALELQVPGETSRTLPRSKFAIFVNRSTPNRPKGTSDLDAAYSHWTSKSTLLAAWKLHLERFASPTVIGSFTRGFPASERGKMLSTLERLHETSAILHPEELSLDTLASKGEGSGAFFEAIDFHNREIARAILGQTLTTDEGRRVGSLALGKVHLQVLLLQLEAIRKELADVVMTEQVIRPIVELNFGPVPPPRFVFESPTLSAFVTGELQ